MKGFDDVNQDNFFELDNGGGYSIRGHHYEVESPQEQIATSTMLFFSHRVVNLWNKLPALVVEASSVNVFKKILNYSVSDVGL